MIENVLEFPSQQTAPPHPGAVVCALAAVITLIRAGAELAKLAMVIAAFMLAGIGAAAVLDAMAR